MHGDVIVVRYADDIVVGFEFKDEAEQFWSELKERMEKFQLELHPKKTRLFEFGRHAAKSRKRAGLGKPETFDFLGFTHICGKTKKGRFMELMPKRLQEADLTSILDVVRQSAEGARMSEIVAALKDRAPRRTLQYWLKKSGAGRGGRTPMTARVGGF